MDLLMHLFWVLFSCLLALFLSNLASISQIDVSRLYYRLSKNYNSRRATSIFLCVLSVVQLNCLNRIVSLLIMFIASRSSFQHGIQARYTLGIAFCLISLMNSKGPRDTGSLHLTFAFIPSPFLYLTDYRLLQHLSIHEPTIRH